MTTSELLERLRRLDVRLRAEGGRVRFNAPRGVMTPQLRAELARHKGELLTLLRETEASEAPPIVPIPRAPGRALPASFAQQRLWFLARLDPDSPAYNMPAAVAVDGPLDTAALRRSLTAIVRRHESQRTRFADRDGGPVQIIDPPREQALPIVDLSALPPGRRQSELRRHVAEDAGRPFDLERGPLLRTTLLRLGARRHVILVCQHHVVSDAWSAGLVVREIGVFYPAFASGEDLPRGLPELPVQYADFAVWQRRWLQGEVLERQLAWWRRQLDGWTALDLPTDRPRPAVWNPRGAELAFLLPAPLVAAVETVGRKREATLYMTLLAAFQVLLARTTGQRDVAVGSPVAGRQHYEIEHLIGFFVNTLVLRQDLGGEPRFADLLKRVRQTALGAYAHQDVPFEKLVEALQPERDQGRTPFFQVMLAVQTAPAEAMAIAGLTLTPLATDGGTAKFDLTVELTPRPEGLVGRIEYAVALFDATTVGRMSGHFRTLLAALVADPDRRLTDYSWVSAAERHQLLVGWNDTATASAPEGCIHELFEAQVERTPDAVAVVLDPQRLSYRELNRRANRLAHALRAWGVGPEVPVGIFMARSPQMVVAILGVLKAGGAYLPIDPAAPAERVAYMLRDAGVAVLLTREPYRQGLGELAARVATINGFDHRSDANPPCRLRAENLAYVIYTSGSTGLPKGTEIAHRGLINLVAWHRRQYRVTPADRATQLAGPGFDAAVWELWPYLTAGASIHVPEPEVVAAPGRLLSWLAAEGITLSFLPTPLAEAVLAEPPPYRPRSPLRALLTGGDRLHEHPARDLPFALVNHYGPTESTVVTTFTPVIPRHCGAPPIGRPLPNLRVHLLDRGLRPVPIGVVGQLHVAGPGLARGYLGRPALTAEKFVPHPFAEEPGDRLYQSGDLCRFRPDGNVDFLGRIDHQVKVRGFRIELGEIEAVLLRHPGVREVVVVVREEETPGGGRALLAYLVAAEGAELAAGQLRAWLGEQLPEYMVPAAMVFLDALPLSPSGKVDRRALPAPDLSGPTGEDRVPPRNPIEAAIAGIWSQLLGVDEVDVDDDFFELGGHSLLATQVISQVREAFGPEVPVRQLFETPTLASFAEVLAAKQGEGRTIPPLRPAAPQRDVPLSFAQERLWFLDQFAPGSSAYNIAAALRLTGRLAVPALMASLGEIVRRHEALRTTFARGGDGSPVQVISSEAHLDLPIVDLEPLPASAREAETRRLATEEARRPFDLSRGPLVRMTLVRLAGTPERAEHVMLFTIHHIISDGWSTGVLIRELAALCDAFVAGKPSPLPELAVQYADYSVWQRQWLCGELLEQEVGYWKGQLSGAPHHLELPTDRPRPAVRSLRGRVRPVALSPELAASLTALGRREGVTTFMTLLAGLQVLLGRHTGQQDVSVGIPIAGRNHRELEALIGFFVNTLVMRTDLSGEDGAAEPSFRQLLARVRRVALDAYAHQDVPFERLVEELQPQRDMSTTPLFQVMFAHQNLPWETLDLPGLTLSPVAVEARGTAKFELTLALEESAAGIVGELEYAADLFDATTMARLVAHFERLLEGAVEDPARRLSELPWWTEPERHELLVDWNDTRGEPAGERPLHELFEAQVRRSPEAVAVVLDDRRLSYRELNLRANRLAHRLRALGVGPEVPVAIYLERSPEIVIAILAVLKAGGHYVPLDPTYPRERLGFMVKDGRIPILVTREALASELLASEARTVRIDPPGPWPSSAEKNPTGGAAVGNLAYVLYTSGSTGRPKGVACTHVGVINLLADFTSRAPLAVGDACSWWTSPNFDVSVYEIFSALLAGGSLHVVPARVHADGERFVEWLAAERIASAYVTPSMLPELADRAGHKAHHLALRRLLVGVEPISEGLLAAIREGVAGLRIINGYGPTEATVCCTLYNVGRRPPAERTTPIGRALRNTSIYLLDRHLRPVPAGAAGELHIGGDGLARGYLGRPQLTAERFVPDPFSEQGGGRLYRTGDLVRALPAGEMTFQGRIDHQVKIRGFRIELGEIEAVLDRHPAVREAVVLAREDGPGGAGVKRLVAYLVAAPGAEIAQLRDDLKDQLPEYMVPEAFVELVELPLTPNGKVDRKALPAPVWGRGERQRVRSRTPVEELLTEIWAELLETGEVGVDDDFFELGGHSLLATRLASRIRELLAVELPLHALFEQPTVAALAREVEAAMRREQGPEAPPIRPVPRDGPLPPSFAQQRLWFIDRYDPGSALYNVPTALRLSGRLDLAALAGALEEIVRRHEVLRTVFATVDGEPVQVVLPPPESPLGACCPGPEPGGIRSGGEGGGAPSPRVGEGAAGRGGRGVRGRVGVDLARLPEPERRTEADRLARHEARRPFDLARGPVIRAGLLRLGAQQHVLLLTVHHVAFDGWSVEVFLRELRILYQAFSAGRPSPLPELAIQYADFAVWQHQWLRGEVLDRLMAYWRRQLAGLPVVELPTDRPRPALQTFRGGSVDWRLSGDLHRRLEELGRGLGSTLYMSLLAAFQVLLGRYTGQQDLAVGSPIANRGLRELEELVGFFVNTLVLRADLSGDPTFRQLVARVREVALDAYAHQDLPFEKLVEELDPERDLSQNPLVQVFFALQNAPAASWELGPGVAVEPLDAAPVGAKFDLTLGLQEGEDGWYGGFEYNRDLFDALTIRRLAAHFTTLLGQLVAEPDRVVSAFSLLRPPERQQLLIEWRGRTTPIRPAAPSLHQLFAAQAERTPDRVAVICAGANLPTRTLSYGQLDARATQVAHQLRALGVGPEVVVGIAAERGPEVVVGLLGILKAGGAVLPLDPAHPAERLAFMLEDAGARVLLAQESIAGALPPPAEHGAQVTFLDSPPGAVAEGERTDNPDPDCLAYLIYTSGTTGVPKGVAVSHRQVLPVLCWFLGYFGLDDDTRVLQNLSYCFDFGVFELLTTILAGGSLHFLPASEQTDLGRYAEAVAVHRLNTVHTTPSFFRELMAHGRPLDGLEIVHLGGEAVSRTMVRQMEAVVGERCRVYNGYGPTETSINSTVFRLRGHPLDRDVRASGVPIGRATANTSVRVLDRRGWPLPVGVPGELCIGGGGVARGYLKRPALTAERFVPDPFAAPGTLDPPSIPPCDKGGRPLPSPGQPGARLYRSGDLVRWLPEGELEFLGRIDQQVKIRGLRIELGEIEAVLGRHPAVREAVALAVSEPGRETDTRLIAYAVRDAEAAEPDPRALRAWLTESLPGYMVPATVVFLDALPRSTTGKVNRRALSRRPLPAPDGERPLALPRTPLEKLVAGIWGEVLGVERVGLGDNFFELGGHSLLAAKVFARLNESLATELPLPLIFDVPSLGELAARLGDLLGRRQGGPELVGRVEIEPRDPDLTHLPLSFSQERLWVLDRLEPGSTAYNIPFPARLRGEVAVPVLERCLGEIVRRHESLRTTFTTRDGEPVQVVDGGEGHLPLVDLTHLAETAREAEARTLASADAATGFDLARGPLYRAALLRLGPRDHVLLQNMHHIVSDGWSIGVIFRELAALLDAYGAGRPPSLPALPIQYPDFALWQRRRLCGELLERQLAYWRQQLGGALPTLELPADRPRPPVQSHRGSSVRRRLPAALRDELAALAQGHGASLFMVLLAAFKVLLYRFTGQEDLIVGTPIAGRERLETEGLVGFFLNTLALRTEVAGELSFGDLLGRVRRVVLAATAHQEVPFEKLLEELRPERNLSHSPVFQVFFNMLNLPDQQVPLIPPRSPLMTRGDAPAHPHFAVPGLEAEPLATSAVESKFDLTLYVSEPEGELELNLVYGRDLYDRVRMVEMLAQYAALLARIADRPEAAIGTFSLVTVEAHKLLPQPAAPLSDRWEGSLCQGFARQAERDPDQLAVCDPAEEWSYGELDRRSNQLARYLVAGGVEPGSVVAVWAHRSASLVWALVGILKAGAAFMILDPAYPAARLGAYLRLGRPRGWLEVAGAEEPPPEVLARVDELAPCRLRLPPRRVAAARDFLAEHSSGDPGVEVGADDLAYVAFTSGSTGEPKGILGRHGPLTHFLPWLAARFGFDGEDRHSLLSALSHDPLHRDVFMPLWYGATICIPDPDEIGTPGYLARWIGENRLTVLNAAPAMLQLVCHRPPGGEVPLLASLRWAFVVGDVLTRGDVEALYALAPAVRCVNYYGSTETQRAVSYFVAEPPGDGGGRSVVPVGRGIEDVQLLILNPAGGLAGVGELGEIHFRSHHLARGYLGDEALTRERFLTNPFTGVAGDRLYRTGDLGRYRPDGTVEFLGRADHQVKVRGFRVELGEIEALLGRHPAVRECAVGVRERGGDRRLVAWVAAADRPEPRRLRSYVSERLPDYMVPSDWVFLDALPMTRTGKIDRAALPTPERRAEPGEGWAAPRGADEEILAAICGKLLAVERVAADDDFFALGGHSLLATQLLSRVRESLGVELPLRRVFESSTVAGLARAVAAARLAGAGPAAPPLEPVPRDRELPLSFAQERLWFLDQLEPGSSAYVLSGALRLRGELDPAAAAASLTAIVGRHEALRTRFVSVAGEARQMIGPPGPHPLPLVDLDALPAAARWDAARQLAAREAQTAFDLARGPLLRSTLVRLEAQEHVLLLSMHHVVSDGWSLGILVRELTVWYAAFSGHEGGPSPLAELPIQYADFACWEREWLRGEVLEAQLAWWRRHLAGAPPVLELPTDRPRPAIETFRGSRRRLALPAPLAARTRGFSRERGLTVFMTLLAAFDVLLARHAHQPDVVVGTPIAHRGRSDLEPLIGLFANTLVLRADLGGDPSFGELCQRVREVALGAYAHQDMPFEKLVEELQPRRDLSHSPLFQVMFILQNAPMPVEGIGGLTIEALEIEYRRAQFDLTLTLFEDDTGLWGWIEYNTDLFDATTAERLARRYRRLLEGAFGTPDRAVSELPLTSPSERRQLLGEWNDTAAAECRDRSIHDLVADQARRTPDAIAVEMADARLSYRRLDAASDHLAAGLRTLGAGPEALVAVMTERSPEMVVALVAILKTGAAYLPLSPSFPRERLAYMLDDAGSPLILVEEGLRDRLPRHRAREVLLDVSPLPSRVAAASGSPDRLAYVLYTSGTTGRPKGVAVTHRTVVNFLASMAREPGLDGGDRLLAVTTLTFDIAVLELFLPLTVGARVVVASREQAADGRQLAQLLAERRITALQGTPATWRLLLEAGWPEGVGKLKVLCGGEAMPRELAERLLARAPELWNLYGPTETTVWSAVHRVGAGSSAVPVGRPIGQTQIYLLDAELRPVPLGVAGELHIGGAGLARGYHGRPALSAEKFLPDPFAALPGQRLYDTGDLGRYLADGRLDFLGRRDHQVKVRGFRIELREIEVVLSGHPGVAQAAVVARADAAGDQRLVAYLVPAGEAVPSGEVRDFLRQHLPDYMVPSLFVALPSFPLTASGKVDRRALPEPELARPELRGLPVAPRDHLELALARIWEELLGIHPIGVRDNFFELGGHSLSAVRLMARIEQELGRELPLTALFQGATIEQLATRLRRGGEPTVASCLVALQPGGSRRPLFCVHPAGGNVLCYVPLAQALGPEQPFYAFQARGLAGDGEPHERVEEMAAHYLAELRALQPRGPYQLAGWSFGGLVAYEMARQLRAEDEEVGLLALLDTGVPSGEGPEMALFDDDAFWLADVAVFLARLAGQEPPFGYDELRELAPDEQGELFVARLRAADLLPPETGLDQVRRLLRVYKANTRASLAYAPRSYPGPMTLLRAAEQRAEEAPGADPTLGWGRLAAEPVTVHTVPGDHLTLLARDNVEALAQRLGSCLLAQRPSTGRAHDESACRTSIIRTSRSALST